MSGAKKNSRLDLNKQREGVPLGFDVDEAGVLEPRLDLLERRIVRQVRVEAIDGVLAIELAQHLAIEIVELAVGAGQRQRDGDAPARLGDARELADGALGLVELVEPGVADDQIVDVVGEDQLGRRRLAAKEDALARERARPWCAPRRASATTGSMAMMRPSASIFDRISSAG